jgi:hypothetical protein
VKNLVLIAVFSILLNFNVASAKTYKNIDLKLGSFVIDGEFATQVVSVTNHTGKPLKRVQIECTYYGNTELIASSSNFVESLDNDETGSANVLADKARGSGGAKCRIVSAE